MFKSVFTKMLVVMIVTGFLLNVIVFAFAGKVYKNRHRLFFKKNIVPYINYLIENLGSPPDQEKAKQFSSIAGLKIQYQGHKARWTTSDDLIPMPENGHTLFSEGPVIRIGRIHHRVIISVQRSTDLFLIELMNDPIDHTRLILLLAVLLLLLSFTVVGAYFAINKILRPVKGLKQSVDEIRTGNLSHRISIRGRDELQDLGRAFNGMMEQITGMLESKERLLTDVSHELRSPIARMKVALELIPDDRSKISIRDDIDEMENMVTEILETARISHMNGELNTVRTDLLELIHGVVQGYRTPSSLHIMKPLPTHAWVDIEPEQIKTVIKNIISNALKYSEASTAPVEITVLSDQDAVTVQIKDNGTGIPEDELTQIFEPFYRIDKSRSRSSGGYGLGLSLCKTVMEAHGGTITVHNNLDGGAMFVLVFRN